jgi:hypothetical protein
LEEPEEEEWHTLVANGSLLRSRDVMEWVDSVEEDDARRMEWEV